MALTNDVMKRSSIEKHEHLQSESNNLVADLDAYPKVTMASAFETFDSVQRVLHGIQWEHALGDLNRTNHRGAAADVEKAGITTGFTALVQEFNVGYSEVAPLVGYCVLCLGISCFLWIPTSIIIGKRYVLLLANLMFLCGCIWSTQAVTLQSLLGSRILASLGAGAVQALGPAVIGEVFMERHYSKAIGAYAITLCAGSQIGPTIGGHIVQEKGWRWFFILCCILVSINLVLALFTMPETSFDRNIAFGTTAAEIDERISRDHSGDKPRLSILTQTRKNLFYRTHPHITGGGLRMWIVSFVMQFEFILDPLILFAAGIYGMFLTWVVLISIATAQLFAPPPFLFSPAELGNWTATSFIGVILAFPLAGPLTDLISRQLSARSRTHKPEYRLLSLFFPLVICPPGLLLFKYTYISGSYIGPAIGFAMQCTSLTFVPAAVLSYAIDCYPQDASESVAMINAVTHLLPFAISKTGPAWIQRDGIERVFNDMTITEWTVCVGLTVVLFLFGMKLRKRLAVLHATFGIKAWLVRKGVPDVNDVMLWHTYVNSQLTSSIKGDADLAVWRRIGDLSTDVLGMGLHREETSVCSSIPFFLGQCRRRIFVHTYQLDKFFSTFFNDRPPRLLKQYTTCPVPLDLADDEILTIGASPNAMEEAQRLVTTEGWNKKPIVSSSTWARVRYILGELREELIHLDTSKNAQAQQYKDLLEQCDTRWAAVPDHVKYTPDCWQSDMEHYMCFMFGKVYLTYVHLKMRILQSMVQMLPDMKSDLLRTAADILDIVVQHGSIPDRSRFPKGELSTMILGYGIPCASQWITAMQEPSIEDGLDIPSDIHRGKLIQNLSVFVSHLKNVCQPNEENYDFCVHAHTAISRALDDVLERFALRRPTGHRLDATQGFTSELQDLSQVSTSQVSGEEQYRPESRPFETPDLSQWYSDIDWRTISMDWNVL
ncbi:Hypothetical protein D9617_10g073960 [Elsinoe fawcettii]|nr:Hypothetical protein D9617_10g073960 [Elsinoe fawcettii]